MATEIWVALITLVGTLIGTFSGIVVGTKLINYRIESYLNTVLFKIF